MSKPHEKPGSPGDLVHYGVKGMKWGVRREDKGGGGGPKAKEKASHNEQTKEWMAAANKANAKPISDAQARANFAQAQAKSAAKIQPSEAPPQKGAPGEVIGKTGMSTQKKVALGAGALGVAYVAYQGYSFGKMAKDLLDVSKNMPPPVDFDRLGITKLEDLDRLAGKPIGAQDFHGLVGLSQGKTWFGDTSYLTDSAFARPAFELPAGHIFHRLSTKAEDSFKDATYSTHSLDDFHRYVAGFRQEKGLGVEFNHVEWKTTAPVKVPDLTTVLGTLHRVMSDDPDGGGGVTHERVMREYQNLSGGGWNTGNGSKLIKRLKESGYDAIVDEMDAGVIGETPLVFFSPEKAGKKINSQFDTDAITRAEALLKEIGKPPGRKY